MGVINSQVYSEDFVKKINDEFNKSKPYRHFVIDNFLNEEVAETIASKFPTKDDMRRSYKNINENKSEGSNFDGFHPYLLQVKKELETPEFSKALTAMTGLEGLILPEDHRGSGVHQGFNGSYLDVHVDFSVHPTLKLHRRFNLLIFFNKDWKDEYGGKLELWDPEVQNLEAEYLPAFNRAVVFECSDISFHGYSKITVPENVTRKSFYSYFYTELGEGVKYHDTIFKARPSEGLKKKVVTDVKETTKNVIKKALYKLGLDNFFNKYE